MKQQLVIFFIKSPSRHRVWETVFDAFKRKGGYNFVKRIEQLSCMIGITECNYDILPVINGVG